MPNLRERLARAQDIVVLRFVEQRLDVRHRGIWTQQQVAGGDHRRVGRDQLIKRALELEGVRIDHREHRMEIAVPQVNRRRGEEQPVARNGVCKPAEPVEQGLGVAHVMGLVDHHEIDEGLPMARFIEKPRKLVSSRTRLAFVLLGVIVPPAGRTQPLHAAYKGVAAPGLLRAPKRAEKLSRIPNLGLDAEPASKLILPLLAQRLGTGDQQAIAIEPSTQLGPD